MSYFPPPALRQVVGEVAKLLKERKETVSVAETAAGGLISASLLSVPGASSYYKGGLTLYTLPSRISYGGWTTQQTSTYSGPTPQICTGLAQHTLNQLNSTYCISESGTAGPTASAKPDSNGEIPKNRQPGYCALSVVDEKGGVWEKEVESGLGLGEQEEGGEGVREENMVAFAVAGLNLLKEVLKGRASL